MTAHTWTACSGSGSGSKGRCFSPPQAECLLTRRTPPVCWGCVAELWCFSPSLSSGTRLTLCKKHFQFWPLMQLYSLNVSRCNYLQNSRMNPLFMEDLKAKWGHIFPPRSLIFLSLMWIDSPPFLDLRAGSSILFPSVKKKKKKSENSKKTFSHWFHTWKKHILSRKMMSSEDFLFCFSCGKPSVGTKKKRPGYPKKIFLLWFKHENKN